MMLTQCNFAHLTNVSPLCWGNVGTMSVITSSDIGPTVGQHVLNITNAGPVFGQHWPNIRLTLAQCQVEVGLT